MNEKQAAQDAIEELIGTNRPHPVFEHVDPDALMTDLVKIIKDHVMITDHGALTAALWIIQTWCYEQFERCPLLLINAPERASGKSVLLKLIGMLVHRPFETSNITLASLFRVVSTHAPTLLIDEIDTFMEGKGELAGIINMGYSRGGVVLRMESNGKDFVPRAYRVYGPKAMAGIALERSLPDPTLSRGIQVSLKRKTRDVHVRRLRLVDRQKLKDIYSRIKAFVDSHQAALAKGWDDLPEEMSDREQDNWESLLAIANCLGPHWYQQALAAARAIADETSPPKSASNQLLEDVREVLITFEDTKISSAELLGRLLQNEDAAWSTYNRGQPMVQHQLSKMLSGYGIKSKTIRLKKSTPKGFEVRDFEDAFARYLPMRSVLEKDEHQDSEDRFHTPPPFKRRVRDPSEYE